MLTPSPEILPILAVFAPAMTTPTFTNALTLLVGVILTPGRRTVTTALWVLGLQAGNFSKYHRLFSRAQWSAMQCSRLLLLLLVRTFLAAGEALQVIVDEHVERRKGRQLAYRGLFRDPVRSTAARVQYAWGIRWLCFCLLVSVPWSTRRWALPFLLVPVLSERTCQRLGKKHRSVVEETARVIAHLRRWVPEREVVLVGDGTYAAVPLVLRCQQLARPVRLVSRLRLDAVLHHFPAPRAPGQRGKTPKKGARQPNLRARLADPTTSWQRVSVRWYGSGERLLEIATGVSLWYRGGHPPAPLRWVLVRSPAGDPQPIEPGACFCSDPAATPEQVLGWFIGRWNIEVTFAEVRAHLGFEGQRHWCRRAVGRVTPCLFGLFSLVVVLAKQWYPQQLPLPQSRWYRKEEATFADALAAVRRHLWSVLLPLPTAAAKSVTSEGHDDVFLIPSALWDRLQRVVCYAP